jgi:hypothetical protein
VALSLRAALGPSSVPSQSSCNVPHGRPGPRSTSEARPARAAAGLARFRSDTPARIPSVLPQATNERKKLIPVQVRPVEQYPLIADPQPGWHDPTVEEQRELAEAVERETREWQAWGEEIVREEDEADERWMRECDAEIEADIASDLNIANILEKAKEKEPDDAELIAHCRASAEFARRSLAIDRRERIVRPPRSLGSPPARRMIERRRGGCERRPGARRVARAHAPPGADDPGGDGEHPHVVDHLAVAR